MKLLVLLSMLMMSFTTFAGEVLTCELNPKKVIKITKEEDEYFYSINGKRAQNLALAQTVQAKDLKKEPMLQEIMSYTGIPASEVSRANVYQLTRNDDGGQTIIRFIFKDNTYLAAYVTMGGVVPCL